MDHRMPKHDDRDVRYGARHTVRLVPGGRFAAIAGATEIKVNSLHGQGIVRPAAGIKIEGFAPDGTPEALVVTGARSFALGVQWYPEHKPLENDFSSKLFRAFSEADCGSS